MLTRCVFRICVHVAILVAHLAAVQTTSTLRLTRGAHPWTGYLEVYHGGRWGTVCDDSFTPIAAGVACRQMGFSGSTSWRGSGHKYGLTIWLDEVRCTGHESRLEDCSHNSWGTNDCNDENVQITCSMTAAQECASFCNGVTTCDRTVTPYVCHCPSTLTGSTCQQDVNECLDRGLNECSHECTNLNKTGYTCSCPDPQLLLGPDQHNCYSPHAGVTCTSSGMSVSLSKAGLVGLRAEYMRVDGGGAGCQALDTPFHIALNLPLNDCGTTRRAEGDEWVYENHITSRDVTVAGVVTPVRKLNVTVRCRYPQSVHVHEAYNVHSEQLTFRQNQDGQFPIQLNLEHNGHVYQPGGAALVVDPGAPLTLHLSLGDSDPDLELMAQNCVATPTSDVLNGTQYRIIQDGCVLDSTLQSVRNGSEEMLTLQAFKFVGQASTVFLHCDVIVCNASEPASRCHQGCLQPSTASTSSSSITSSVSSMSSTSSVRRRDEESDLLTYLEHNQMTLGSDPLTYLEHNHVTLGPLRF